MRRMPERGQRRQLAAPFVRQGGSNVPEPALECFQSCPFPALPKAIRAKQQLATNVLGDESSE